MKSNAELRKLTIDELQAEVLSLRREQFALRLKKANGELDKTHVVKMVRRAIARIKTIIVEKADHNE